MDSQPPTTKCNKCGKTIMFDGYIRSPKGSCFPLNPDYSFHLCYGASMSLQEAESMMVAQLESICFKLNKGMRHYRIKLSVVEDKPDSFNDTGKYTQEQRLMLLSRV